MKMTVRGFGGIACVAALASGCATRVMLPAAPPRSAPISQRAAFYEEHRPTSALGTMTYSSGSFGMMGPVSTRWEQLILANGTAVSDPRDLAQVVGDNSPTAVAAESSARSARIAAGFFGGGLAASAVGLVLALASISGTSAYDGDGFPPVFWAGIGLSLGGSISISIGRWGFGTSADASRAAAFQSYDGSLRARLRLCSTGHQLHDCDAPAAPPPPAATTPTVPGPWMAPPPLPPAPAAGGVSL